MAANVYPKVLKIGTQEAYNAIENKDSSVLYFTSDTRKLYKGALDFSEYARYVQTKPTTTAGLAKGCVYMMADTGNVEFYDGSNWHTISLPYTTSFDDDSADDLHVPTTEAVKEYVYEIIGGASNVVADVSATTTDDSEVTGYVTRGGITVTQGDESKKVIQVPGVATTLSGATGTDAAGKVVLAHTSGNDDTVTVPGVVTGLVGATNATGQIAVSTSTGSHENVTVPGVATTLAAGTDAAGKVVLAHTSGNDNEVVVPGVATTLSGATGTDAAGKVVLAHTSGNDDTVTVPGVVTGITAATGTGSEGKFSVSTTTGTHEDVVVPGVFKSVAWDSTARTLTFTDTSGVSTGTTHVVDLGKDIFIDQNANNRYENGNIYLYLNDGATTSEDTQIVIPVTGLITDYFGDDTSSISVDVDNTTHKVTANAILRPDVAPSGSDPGWTNSLKLSTTTGAVGLYVDTTDIEANIDALGEAITWGTF